MSMNKSRSEKKEKLDDLFARSSILTEMMHEIVYADTIKF